MLIKKVGTLILAAAMVVLLIATSACGHVEATQPEHSIDDDAESIELYEDITQTEDFTVLAPSDIEIEESTEFKANNISNEMPTSELFIMFFLTDSPHTYYYIPDEVLTMKLMLPLHLESEAEVFPRGEHINTLGVPLGYIVVHDNIQWEAWNCGRFVSFDPNQFEYVSVLAPEAIGLLQDTMSGIGVPSFQPNMINGITSAIFKTRTSGDEQIITDSDKLADLEEMLSGAVSYDAGCPFDEWLLVLTLSSGDEIALAMGSEGVNAFNINGQTFSFGAVENATWYEHFLMEVANER